MANNDFQYAGMPIGPGSDVSVQNTDVTDMTSGQIVKLDTAHPFSATQANVGILKTTTDDYPYGVLIENIPVGQVGRCRISGKVVLAAGSANAGVITIGDIIQCDATSQAKTRVTLKAAIGVSEGPTTAAQGDNFVATLRQTPAA